MESSELLACLVAALLLGVLIGWSWARIRSAQRIAALAAAADSGRVAQLEVDLTRAQSQLATDAAAREAQLVNQVEEACARCESAERERAALAARLSAAEAELARLGQQIAAAPRPEEPAPAAREETAEAVAATPEPPAPAPVKPPSLLATLGPPITEGDDFKAIFGIGPVLERLLKSHGVLTYRQIASWTPEDIRNISAKLSVFPDRIERDAWVQGARDEHFKKYGERLG